MRSVCVSLKQAPGVLQGWLMRNTPSPPGVYLAALALVAGPQLVGSYAGTILALLAGWRSQRVRAAPQE